MEQDDNTPWQYKPDHGAAVQDNTHSHKKESHSHNRQPEAITWEAPEFIDHPHGAGWYAGLFIVTLAFAALVLLIAKDAVASVIIALVGIIVGIFAAQRPSQAKYEISNTGLSINGKLYRFSNYKSFAVIREGSLSSVNLFPLKRFMPPLSAYFQSEEGDKITEVLGEYLPYEDRKLDGVERIARRLRL